MSGIIGGVFILSFLSGLFGVLEQLIRRPKGRKNR